MKDPTFRGVFPALTTPFRPDLSLDVEGFARLDRRRHRRRRARHRRQRLHRRELVADRRRARDASSAPPSRPRAAACASSPAAAARRAAESLAKIRQAADAGCALRDGVAALVHHARPGRDPRALPQDPRRLAAAGPALQHSASHRRQPRPLDIVDRLADDPKVVGIKESSKDWGLLSSVIRRTRDRISVFAGYASFFGLAALCEGAVGYIDSGTPVFGAKSLAFHDAATERRPRDGARAAGRHGADARARTSASAPSPRASRRRSTSSAAPADRRAIRSARSTPRSAKRCAS